jgi:hypothetical protein
MHRADDQDVFDPMRAFMSLAVTLILTGVNIPGIGLLREATRPAAASPRCGPAAAPAWRKTARKPAEKPVACEHADGPRAALDITRRRADRRPRRRPHGADSGREPA